MKRSIAERYEDIARRSGLSVEVVKRVISAQGDSVLDSILHGEEVTIPLVCNIEPYVDNYARVVNGTMEQAKCIKMRIHPSTTLIQKAKETEGYKRYEEEDGAEDIMEEMMVRSRQISALL